MAYNSNIPQATDIISQSQSDLLANFQALAGIGGSNLLPYLLLGPVQGSKPTVSSQMALYTKTSSLSAIQAMFLEKADGTEIEISSFGTSSVSNSTHGWTILPSGLILKWGRARADDIVGAGDLIVFPVAGTIPVFTMNPFMVQLSGQLSTGTASHQITVTYSQATTTQIAISVIRDLSVSGGTGATVTLNSVDQTNTYINYLALGI